MTYNTTISPNVFPHPTVVNSSIVPQPTLLNTVTSSGLSQLSSTIKTSSNQIFAVSLSNAPEKKARKIIEILRPFINLQPDPVICNREGTKSSLSDDVAFRFNIYLNGKGKLIAWNKRGTDIYLFDKNLQDFQPYKGSYNDFAVEYSNKLCHFRLNWNERRTTAQMTSISCETPHLMNNPTADVTNHLQVLAHNLRLGASALIPGICFNWIIALEDSQNYSLDDLLEACPNPLPAPQPSTSISSIASAVLAPPTATPSSAPTSLLAATLAQASTRVPTKSHASATNVTPPSAQVHAPTPTSGTTKSKSYRKALKIIEALRPVLNMPSDAAVCNREHYSENPTSIGFLANEIYLNATGKLKAYKNHGTEIYFYDKKTQSFTVYQGSYSDFEKEHSHLSHLFLNWNFKTRSTDPQTHISLNSRFGKSLNKKQSAVTQDLQVLMENLRGGALALTPYTVMGNMFGSWTSTLTDTKKYSTKEILAACPNLLPIPSMTKAARPPVATTAPIQNQAFNTTKLNGNQHLTGRPVNTPIQLPKPKLADVKIHLPKTAKIKTVKHAKKTKLAKSVSSSSQSISSISSLVFKKSTSKSTSLKAKTITRKKQGCPRFLKAIGRFFKRCFKFIY